MNWLKLILCMLFLTGTTTSCRWLFTEKIWHGYNILLSFRDTLGNDLISGIEFDYYDDNITYDELRSRGIFIGDIESYDDNDRVAYGEISNADVFYLNNSINFSGSPIVVRIIKLDDYYYLLAGCSSFEDVASLPHGRIVIKLRCPHIFGDNDLYEFITYWEPEGKKIPQSRDTFFHECSHIDLNGKEFPIEKNQYLSNASTSATIILDK